MSPANEHEIPNEEVADQLDEVARALADQGANPYRVRAYERGAATVRSLDRPVAALLGSEGLAGLDALPGIGPGLAHAIRDVVVTGRLPMLARLRGEADPVALLMSVPGVGRRTAERAHHDLGIDTLEDLETAAHDGRLAEILGLRGKRLAGLKDALAQRLRRLPQGEAPAPEAPVGELLDVDREYRTKAAAGLLYRITPRRHNPRREAWLPVLHTHRGDRHYTALFSNTPRAHERGATRDWVVIYYDGSGRRERQCTIVTARFGPLQGSRVVMGREGECARHYALPACPPPR